VVIDPLQAFVGGDINADPAVAQTLWSALSQITALTGAAVMVLHHMKKDGAHEMKSLAQAREGIRGTSAIVDGARLALAMYPLDTDRAQTASKSTQIPYEFGTYVAGGVVKSNDQNDKSEHFFIRAETGLLEDRTGEVALAITEGRKLSNEQVSSIFDAISKALENGEPFGTANNSKRPLSKWISENMDVTISVARSYVTAWKDAGHFETHREPGTGRQGIRVHSRPV
ncbi:MAG: AAA family ATPase, partial [Planctomycetota bacterium]